MVRVLLALATRVRITTEAVTSGRGLPPRVHLARPYINAEIVTHSVSSSSSRDPILMWEDRYGGKTIKTHNGRCWKNSGISKGRGMILIHMENKDVTDKLGAMHCNSASQHVESLQCSFGPHTLFTVSDRLPAAPGLS